MSYLAEIDSKTGATGVSPTGYKTETRIKLETACETVDALRARLAVADAALAEARDGLQRLTGAIKRSDELYQQYEFMRNQLAALTAENASLREDKDRLEKVEDMPPFTYTGTIHDIRMAMDVHITNYVRPADKAIDAAQAALHPATKEGKA